MATRLSKAAPAAGACPEVNKEDADFIWLLTEEPHRSRRQQIMKAHPKVTRLMGHEPLTKWLVLAVVSLQMVAAYALRHTSPLSFKFLAVTYVIGATCNQNLFLAIHEITHNLAFRSITLNRMLAIFANFPIGVPYAMLFKKYHIEHHKFLGEDGIDTDLPSRLEALVLSNVFGKAFFCTFQLLFYAIRPGFIRAQKFTKWHAYNFAAQFGFNYLLISQWGINAYLYLVISAFFAGSLHPCAAHFIAEHYVFPEQRKEAQETASYYGSLNWLTYNVGYHQEHHDFPAVAWTKLPALHRMAQPFYDQYYSHPSWPMVTFRFMFDDSIKLFSRVKRKPKASAVAAKPPSAGTAGCAQEIRLQGGLKDFGGILD